MRKTAIRIITWGIIASFLPSSMPNGSYYSSALRAPAASVSVADGKAARSADSLMRDIAASFLKRLDIERPEFTKENLIKIAQSGDLAKAIKDINNAGLLKRLIPSLAELKGLKQGSVNSIEPDAFEHTVVVIENLPQDAPLELKIAAIFHDIGKRETQRVDEKGGISFDNHDAVSGRQVKHIFDALGLEQKLREDAAWLVENHMFKARLERKNLAEDEARHIISDDRFPMLLALTHADIIAAFSHYPEFLAKVMLGYDDFVIWTEILRQRFSSVDKFTPNTPLALAPEIKLDKTAQLTDGIGEILIEMEGDGVSSQGSAFIIDPQKVIIEQRVDENVRRRDLITAPIISTEHPRGGLRIEEYVDNDPRKDDVLIAFNSHQGHFLDTNTLLIIDNKIIVKSENARGFFQQRYSPLSGEFWILSFDKDTPGVFKVELEDGKNKGPLPMRNGISGVPLIIKGRVMLSGLKVTGANPDDKRPALKGDEVNWSSIDQRMAMSAMGYDKDGKLVRIALAGNPNDKIKKEVSIFHLAYAFKKLGVTDAVLFGTSGDVQNYSKYSATKINRASARKESVIQKRFPEGRPLGCCILVRKSSSAGSGEAPGSALVIESEEKAIELLSSEDESVRIAAVRALGRDIKPFSWKCLSAHSLIEESHDVQAAINNAFIDIMHRNFMELAPKTIGNITSVFNPDKLTEMRQWFQHNADNALLHENGRFYTALIPGTYSTLTEEFPGAVKGRLQELLEDIISVLPENVPIYSILPDIYHISVAVLQDSALGLDETNELTIDERGRLITLLKEIASRYGPVTLRLKGIRFGDDGGIIAVWEDSGEMELIKREFFEKGLKITDKIKKVRPKPFLYTTIARILSDISPAALKALQRKAEEFEDLSSHGIEMTLDKLRVIYETQWMGEKYENYEIMPLAGDGITKTAADGRTKAFSADASLINEFTESLAIADIVNERITFAMFKPDATDKIRKIALEKLRERGFSVTQLSPRRLSRQEAEAFYAEHKGKPFYERLIDYITSGEVTPLIIKGPEHSWEILRDFAGANDGKELDTLRNILGVERINFPDGTTILQNRVHVSDSFEAALGEMELMGIISPEIIQNSPEPLIKVLPHTPVERENAGKKLRPISPSPRDERIFTAILAAA